MQFVELHMMRLKQWFLFTGQLIALVGLIYGGFNFSTFEWGIVGLLYFVGGCIGGTVTYHRYLSHRSYEAPSWWVKFGSLCGAVFLIGSPLAWSNNHIAHHRFVDTPKDPHSPQHLGIIKTQFASMLYTTSDFRYSVRNADKFQRFIHSYYEVLHVLLFVGLVVGFGWHITALVYLVPSAVIWHLMSSVNVINHLNLGYRNHETKDSSRNNLVTGYLTFGEGWHNNHHAAAKDPQYGKKWWEFDPGFWVIKVVEKLPR